MDPIRRQTTEARLRLQSEMFAREAGTVRSTLLSTVDPRVFAALIPTDHSNAAIKAALDRIADSTLGLTGLSALLGGGLMLTGKLQVATLALFFSGPVGLAVGGAVGAAVAGAGLWKHFSNPERRKTRRIKSKRDVIRDGLKEILATEVLNHDELAREILQKFVDAAREQYAPLLLEARICVLKARREKEVVGRVFRDTRSFLEIPPPPEVRA